MKTTVIPAAPGTLAAVVSYGNHPTIPDTTPSEIREATLPVIAWRFRKVRHHTPATGSSETIEPVIPEVFGGNVFVAVWLDGDRLLWNSTIYNSYREFMNVICEMRDGYDAGESF